ncbi:MAG: S-layer homology domain-containing protein, partial [Anaerovoracaceae bacterium]
MPTDQSLYQEAYTENGLLPLYAVRHGRETGYFKYRLYVDGFYIRDFSDYVYAKAHADKLEGAVIVADAGVPEMMLSQALAGGDLSVGSSRELSDIQKHWAEATIERLIHIGAIDGYQDGTFRPDNTITRAEFLKLACRSAAACAKTAVIVTAESVKNHWASGIFEAAEEQGTLKSGEISEATWNEPITRYEMARILIRLSENTLNEPEVDTTGIESTMSDHDQVIQSEGDAYYVEQAYGKGLVTGMDESGTFAGDLTGTRAQAAAMVLALVDVTARKTSLNGI